MYGMTEISNVMNKFICYMMINNDGSMVGLLNQLVSLMPILFLSSNELLYVMDSSI